LERISHQVQLAFRNAMGVEDGRGGIEAVGNKSAGLSSLTVRPQWAGRVPERSYTGMAKRPRIIPWVRSRRQRRGQFLSKRQGLVRIRVPAADSREV
jgi:hypothetical protein